jgi:thymidine kinase
MAKLYFRYGAMNSGKSTQLLQTAHNYEERGMKPIIVKPAVDTKAQTRISSRIGVEREVDLLIGKKDDFFKIVMDNYADSDCILVDEAQFLTREQADECMKIVVGLDIPVICYGLRTDFLTNGFPGATRLLEIAHSIEEMKTVCKCGKKAIYNARFVDGTFTIDGGQVAIDGEQNITYESMCAKCYEEQKTLALKRKKITRK